MTADDVVALARHATAARIVAVHIEAVNHCVETRADLRARLRHEQLEERVSVPAEGDEQLSDADDPLDELVRRGLVTQPGKARGARRPRAKPRGSVSDLVPRQRR